MGLRRGKSCRGSSGEDSFWLESTRRKNKGMAREVAKLANKKGIKSYFSRITMAMAWTDVCVSEREMF